MGNVIPVKPIFVGDTVVKLGEYQTGDVIPGEYLAAAPRYNYIVNPCFEINQEGKASVTTSGEFPIDQWKMQRNGSSCTASQQPFAVGQTLVPGEPKNFLRAVVTSSAGVGNFVYFCQPVESVRTLAGRQAVLSFYAQTTGSAKPIAIELMQTFGSGGSSVVSAIGVTKLTLSTGMTKYTVPVTIPSITGKTVGVGDSLTLNIWLDAGSDYNARTNSLGQQSGTFEFANVKLEEGTVATPCIVPRFDEELRKCQRFFVSTYPHGTPPGSMIAAGTFIGNISDNGNYAYVIQLESQMRYPPTIITYHPDGTAGYIGIGATTVKTPVASIVINIRGIMYLIFTDAQTPFKPLVGYYTASARL